MEPSTEDQKQAHLERWKKRMDVAGGTHVRDCVFRLNGVLYDLSAADPKKLPTIVQHGFFTVTE